MFEEDNVPYGNLRLPLLKRQMRATTLCCCSADGVESDGVVRLENRPQAAPTGLVQSGAALSQALPKDPVPRLLLGTCFVVVVAA